MDTSKSAVRLAALRASDSEQLYRWLSDRPLRLLSGSFSFQSRHTHEEWFARAIAGKGDLALGVRLEIDDELIGLAQLLNVHPVHRHAELRIKLDPNRSGQGFGTDAVRQLCRYGFQDLNLNRIYLYVFSGNGRAQGAYLKAGFSVEGRMRSHVFLDGVYEDVDIMGLLRADLR